MDKRGATVLNTSDIYSLLLALPCPPPQTLTGGDLSYCTRREESMADTEAAGVYHTGGDCLEREGECRLKERDPSGGNIRMFWRSASEYEN